MLKLEHEATVSFRKDSMDGGFSKGFQILGEVSSNQQEEEEEEEEEKEEEEEEE